MLGKNLKLPRVDQPDELLVKEVFFTLQGECVYTGRPAVFVRMGGCHLACSFCDTDFDDGELMSPDALVQKIVAVADGRTTLVVITGGEPLRQNLENVVVPLISSGHHIQFETAGNFWWEWMNPYIASEPDGKLGISVVCSPKTKNIHPAVLLKACAFKFIIQSGNYDATTGLPERAVQGEGKLWRPLVDTPEMRARVWLQPCDTGDVRTTATNIRIARDACLSFGYNMSLQTHKIIEVP